MVEIITREFIQMNGTAGEVRLFFLFMCYLMPGSKNMKEVSSLSRVDGAGESQDTTEINAHDELRITAGHL